MLAARRLTYLRVLGESFSSPELWRANAQLENARAPQRSEAEVELEA
jgi:hypothetical protein